jgi:hypothetical protein
MRKIRVNDFTKEELIKIQEACTNWFHDAYDGVGCESGKLVIKIASMIRSYLEAECDHEWYVYDTARDAMAKCTKCGVKCE